MLHFALAFVLVSWATAALSQECSLSASVSENTPLAYRPRGDRCEGMYSLKVANRINLSVVAYQLGGTLPPREEMGLLEIGVGGAGFVNMPELRVISLKERVYYQMDTRSLSPDGRFAWSLELLNSLQIRLNLRDLGAVACAPSCVEQNEGTLIAPVFFSSANSGVGDYANVFVISDVELESIEADLTIGDELVLSEYRFGGRFLPAKRALRLRLPIWEEGVAELVLRAVTRGGQRDLLRVQMAPPVASFR